MLVSSSLCSFILFAVFVCFFYRSNCIVNEILSKVVVNYVAYFMYVCLYVLCVYDQE